MIAAEAEQVRTNMPHVEMHPFMTAPAYRMAWQRIQVLLRTSPQ
jgi:hypothetical protein